MRPDMRWTVTLLATSLLLAGCLGAPEPASDGAAAEPASTGSSSADDPSPRVEAFHQNGTLRATWGELGGLDEGGALTFPVGKNATRIVATLTWTGAGTDLDAVLSSPRWCADDRNLAAAIACSGRSKLLGTHDPSAGWFRNEEGTPAAPDNPSVLTLEADDIEAQNACPNPSCEWSARIFANPATDAAYTYLVEVHYG